jgi:hypothetical protein
VAGYGWPLTEIAAQHDHKGFIWPAEIIAGASKVGGYKNDFEFGSLTKPI